MLYATYLSYRTRDAPDAVNESKSFASAVFLIFFVCVAGLPIVLSLPLDPYLSRMIIGLCFFCATMGACGFYFGQKMFYLLQGADLNAQFRIVLPNGKLAGSSSDKSNIKRATALAKALANSMKGPQTNQEGIRKMSVNEVSVVSMQDSEDDSSIILKFITPEVKTVFLSHDVSHDLPCFFFLFLVNKGFQSHTTLSCNT